MSTFLQLRTELSDRGFAALSATRLGTYINRGRSRIDNQHLWPYREDSIQAVAPISIPALGIVEAVSNETQGYVLEAAGYADLVGWGCDLSLVGSPQFWFKETPAGAPGIGTWPTSTDTIGVQYWAITADMVADADLPDMPARYHGLIVDMAVQMAYRDSDNHQAAEALQVDIDRQIAGMVDDLIGQNEPRYERISADGSTDW